MRLTPKALFAVFMVCLLMSAIASCSQKKSQSTRKVLYVSKARDTEYHKILTNAAKETAQSYGIQIDIVSPILESDVKSQIIFIEEALTTETYDRFIIAPNHSQEIIPSLQKIGSSGGTFVVVDTPLSQSTVNQVIPGNCGYVGTDNVLGGRLAAKYVASKIKEGNVVMIRGVPSHKTSEDRENGFLDQIRKYPKINVIEKVNADWDSNKAVTGIIQLIKSGRKIDAIFAYNDPMILQISIYFLKQNSRPLLIGYNGDRDVQVAILNKQVDASIVQTPELMGKKALELLLGCAKKDILTPVSVLTSAMTLKTITDIEE